MSRRYVCPLHIFFHIFQQKHQTNFDENPFIVLIITNIRYNSKQIIIKIGELE